MFGFFHFLGSLVAGGAILALAVCAGGFFGGCMGSMVKHFRTGKDDGVLPGLWFGAGGFALWAIYCLATAATLGAALLGVLGLGAAALIILIFAFVVLCT